MKEESCLDTQRTTCADVKNFAVFFDELRHDISEVLPVLIPVKFGGVPVVMTSVTLHIFFPRRSVCHNGCSFRNTFRQIINDLYLKFITSRL